MDQLRSEQLASILELSQHMLVAAQAGDWNEVTALETRRELLVGSCFSHSTSEQDASYVAQAIREILQLNQTILELGHKARTELGKQMTAHATGKAAVNAYRDCSHSL